MCKLNLNQSLRLQQLAYNNQLNQNNLSTTLTETMDTDSDSMEASFLKVNPSNLMMLRDKL